MNKKPLLSIGMPTYNRLRHIKRQIAYFQSELDGIQPGLVEVLISDNASSDGTYEYLQTIDDDRITIHHNTENIGGMGNMNLLLSMATGRYLWLPGDDDYLRRGLIKRVLAILSTYDLTFLYLSRRVFKEKERRVAEEGKTHCIKYDRPIRVTDRELAELLTENFSDLKFQSSGILKREHALRCEREYTSLPEMVRASNLTTFRAIRGMQMGMSYFVSDIVILSGDEVTWKALNVDYAFICDGLFIDFLLQCGLSAPVCRRIKNRQMAANYAGALLDKEMFQELAGRGFPQWHVRLLPIIIRLAVRKLFRRAGVSKYYSRKHVDGSAYGCGEESC